MFPFVNIATRFSLKGPKNNAWLNPTVSLRLRRVLFVLFLLARHDGVWYSSWPNFPPKASLKLHLVRRVTRCGLFFFAALNQSVNQIVTKCQRYTRYTLHTLHATSQITFFLLCEDLFEQTECIFSDLWAFWSHDLRADFLPDSWRIEARQKARLLFLIEI